MRNITLSVDEETYRQARIRAAERGLSLSALVREYLHTLSPDNGATRNPAAELFSILDRAGEYRATDRLSREETHARRHPD